MDTARNPKRDKVVLKKERRRRERRRRQEEGRSRNLKSERRE